MPDVGNRVANSGLVDNGAPRQTVAAESSADGTYHIAHWSWEWRAKAVGTTLLHWGRW